MSAPEAKQHTKLVRFRTTFGARSTTGSIANQLPHQAARIFHCRAQSIGSASRIGSAFAALRRRRKRMLFCSTRYTNRITARSRRQLRRRVRPFALRIGVTNGAEFPSPLSSVRRSSAVASACADSCGTTPSVAFWAGSLSGLDTAFRRDSGWPAVFRIIVETCS